MHKGTYWKGQQLFHMDWLDYNIELYVQFCKTKYKKPTLFGLKLHLQDWQYRGISDDELWARLAFLFYILKDKKK